MQSMGLQESDMTWQLNHHPSLYGPRKERKKGDLVCISMSMMELPSHPHSTYWEGILVYHLLICLFISVSLCRWLAGWLVS